MSGYKTYIVAILMAVLPVLTEKVGAIDWNGILLGLGVPENMVVPAAAAASAIVMVVMRFITQVTTVQTALNTPPPSE